MKRYILRLLVLATFAKNYASAVELGSAVVKISYTYTNDQDSRSAGVVPIHLHKNVDDTQKPHTLTMDVHFYGATRTVEEILDGIIDKLNLNEFVKLHMWNGTKKINATHTFTLEELRRTEWLNIDYLRSENTVECIKARRIQWMVDAIAGVHPHAWGDRANRERIQALVKKNYTDDSGVPRLLRELRTIVTLHY